MSRNRLIVIGRVVKAFGIKGEIRISPFTESFESFERSGVLVLDESSYTVGSLRIHKRAVLATLEGVDTREKADKLVGSLVKTDEKNLPPKEEDEYYWFELIGMKVSTVDGRFLGEITQITPTGANDVLHVEGAYGEVLLPMIDDIVVTVDLQNNAMTVDPLEGLIPDD
ncbi:MAG: ribosome maturation factor RimM [Desulfomonilaceae bacterium]